jgi:acetyl-CoA synthetase
LREFCGLQPGDRATFHLPMVPELPVAMLACARLGVVHSEVFGGFSGAACGDRIADSASRILVTMDGYWRNGELIDHKVKADEAIETARKLGHEVEKVLVWRRNPGQYASETPMVDGRDFFVDEVLAQYRGRLVEPVSMPAEAPLFLMYTSGTTGGPRAASTAPAATWPTSPGRRSTTRTSPRGHVLVRGGHRLDHWPLLHRLRATRHGDDQRHVRRRPTYPDAGRLWRIAERSG